MTERDRRGMREPEDWGPVFVEGEGFGYYDDDGFEPCPSCEDDPPEPEAPACPRCREVAIVYFEGLVPAPYALVAHDELLVASQRELERAWARIPGAWSLGSESMRAMGIGLKPPRRKRPGTPDARGPLVYFIQAGEGGAIKIGFTSKSIDARLADLQTATADELRPLAWVSGSPRLETDLHARFHALHIRGEWFRPEGELLEFIASLRQEQGR